MSDSDGKQRGRDDKTYRFDVDLPGSDERDRESGHTLVGGRRTLRLETPWGGLAIAVCYDLRFPEMCRYLADTTLSILAMPAAFTYSTGRSHWHSLLRARAIARAIVELCYVVAAAQTGVHAGGRQTFGHSLIIGPWGDTLAAMEDAAGFVCADIEPEQLSTVRARFPASALYDRRTAGMSPGWKRMNGIE